MLNKNNNIKIALLELGDQNKAILEFYFASAGHDHYTVVSKKQADAFIMDYDHPAAKNLLTKIKAKTKRPVVLLSINKQTIPATVWLAKPLSAQALTETSDKLKQMLVEIEEAKTTSEQESKDALNEKQVSEEKLNKSIESTDVFELVQKSQEENQLKANLSLAKSTLVATTTSAFDESNNIDKDDLTDSKIKDNSAIKTGSDKNLELPEIIVDEQQSENESNVTETDDVDALLDSLMTEKVGNTLAKKPSLEEEDNSLVNKPSSEDDATDILLKELSLEAELDRDSLDKTDQKENTDSTTQENEELHPEISLEDNSSNVIDNEKVVNNEKESVLLEEDFTLHGDRNPSTEDTYAETLEVDFKAVKQDSLELELSTSNNESLDASDYKDVLKTNHEKLQELVLETAKEQNTQENDESITAEEQLETDLFNFDDAALNKPSENSLESAIESIQLEITDNGLEIENDLEAEEIESDLDSLLKEVTAGSDISLAKPQLETESVSPKVTNINKDFNDSEIPKDEDNSDIELQSLLNEIRDEANKNSEGTSLGLGASSNGHSKNAKAYEKTEADKRWIQLCGHHKGIGNQKEISSISYTLSNHLLDVLLNKIKLSDNKEQVYRLKYNDLIIVLDHSQNKIYCNIPLDDDEYSEICFLELNPEDIKIHDLDYSEVRLYRKKITDNPDRAHSIESFIWSTSLLTSRGRLQADTDINKKVGLKAWPNLTRLELMPNAMQIAAVLSKNPGSLLEIPAWINVEQRYVFAFYNAALALDMIEHDSNKLKKTASLNNNGANKNSEERGFFSRLLKRLKS